MLSITTNRKSKLFYFYIQRNHSKAELYIGPLYKQRIMHKHEKRWHRHDSCVFSPNSSAVGGLVIYTLKFMMLLGFLQHMRRAGGVMWPSIVFLQEVGSLKLSTQHAPNWCVKLNLNVTSDAAYSKVPFKGFLQWDIHNRLERRFMTWKNELLLYLQMNAHKCSLNVCQTRSLEKEKK